MTAPQQQQPAPPQRGITVSEVVGGVAAGLAAQQLVGNYMRMLAAVRARVLQFALAVWRSQPSYHRPDIDRFVDQVVPVVETGQMQVSQLTDAYLRTAYAELTRTPLAPAIAEAPAYSDMRRGVDPAEVYRRPGEQVWTALSENRTLDEAVAVGEQRLTDLVGTDLQLAKTHTAQQVLPEQKRVVGYRRVLTGPHSCGLCIVASTQRYRRAELMPIHPACDCVIAPIVGDHDPGRSINSATLAPDVAPTGISERGQLIYRHDDTLDLGDLLEPAHAAIQQRFGRSYRDARGIDYSKVLLTHEHGEIGPVLGVAGQKFTKRQIARNDLRRRWK